MTQLLQNAVYGTALILAAAALRQVLKDRLVPEARLALWAVCLFRLLTPAAPESVLSLWGLSRLFQSHTAPAAPVPAPQLYIPAAAAPSPAPAAPADPGFPWGTVLTAAWLTVGLALAVWYLRSWTRTRRAVSCAIPLERSDPRYAPLPGCARLREGPMEGAPLTFGVVRPTVVLSPGLEGEALACVLAHEGVHARRRDNLWHYAMALALVVHWWDPAVWLMARLLRRDIELSCDRAALKKLGADRRADYAKALVSLATQAEGPAFCQTFGRKAAEERILAIMRFKKTSAVGIVLSLALVLALTVAFASEPKQPDDRASVAADGDPAPSAALEDVPCHIEVVTLDTVREELDQQVAAGELTQKAADKIFADHAHMLEKDPQMLLVKNSSGQIYGLSVGARHRDENGNPVDVKVRVPAFEADGVPVPSAAPAKTFGDYTIVGYDENGYPLDEQGSHLMFDENGELFMKFTVGYGACIREDCTIAEEHYHKDGEVILCSESNAPTPAFEPTMDNVPVKYPYCSVCTDTRLHLHVDGQTILLPDPCPVEGCTITGNHIHGDTVYSCNGAGHDDGYCDGSCYIYFQPDAAPTSQSPYPVNSKGQTYGSMISVDGTTPDLVAVQGQESTGGQFGYVLYNDIAWGGYPGEINDPDDAMAYMAWREAQPDELVFPLYDSEGNAIGEYRTVNDAKPLSAPSASAASNVCPVCSVDGCTIEGRHDHDGVTYCGGEAHHGDTCDGDSCIYVRQSALANGTSLSTSHHSESHHEDGHH